MFSETYQDSVADEYQPHVGRSIYQANPYIERAVVCDRGIRYVHVVRESLNYENHLHA